MLKNLTSLQHIVEGKVLHFICDNDTPLPHVKEALFKFIAYVDQVENNIKAMQEQQAAAAKQKAEAEATVVANDPEPLVETPKS